MGQVDALGAVVVLWVTGEPSAIGHHLEKCQWPGGLSPVCLSTVLSVYPRVGGGTLSIW